MCGNRFFVPNPSHFTDFIRIPIPIPFPSETLNGQLLSRDVREQIFRTKSLPFHWLYSHSHSNPISVWNLNPIPIFPFEQFPIPSHFHTHSAIQPRHLNIYEEFFFVYSACLCWPATNSVSLRQIKDSKRTNDQMNWQHKCQYGRRLWNNASTSTVASAC